MEQYLSRLRLVTLLLVLASLLFMMSLSGWNKWIVPLILLGFLVLVAATITARRWRSTRPSVALSPSAALPAAAPGSPAVEMDQGFEIGSGNLVAAHQDLWKQHERILSKAQEILSGAA